jgi:hypothetical protein
MSKIVKVSESDYRLIVKPTGTITLDTGVEVGTVRITGNLIVEGTQTTVNTTNLDIEDNIVLKSSLYSISEKSENILIQNKEAISMAKLDSPDVIDDVGINNNLLEDKRTNEEDVKLVK